MEIYRVACDEKANRKLKLKFGKLLQMAVVKFKTSAFQQMAKSRQK